MIPPGKSAPGRGNLSFTSINLPRIAIKAKGDIGWFFEELERLCNLVHRSAAGAVGDPAPTRRSTTSPS